MIVKDETKNLKEALTGKNKFDSRQLEEFFEKIRKDEKKMEQVIRAFCATYLLDGEQRPLKLRPLQLEIVVKALTHPKGDSTLHRKMAILAPRGSGKSWALSVAVVIWMFFKRFRDLVFVVAPNEDQCALIFDYVYRHFKDNSFLDGLVAVYKLHNKPHIKMKGGTILRRAPISPTNQGQSIRGQHPTFLVVDESPLIADRLFIDNVEPAIVSNKAPFINLGTPKNKDNHMYRYLYDENYDFSFERMHFTWRDAIIKGEAYRAPYSENDMLDKMLEWGEDSIYWRTEYECQFVESISNVFNPDQLRACFDDYELLTPDGIEQGGKVGTNSVVGVDIGKSVNSTVISVWRLEKSDRGNFTRLVYLEEISPKTGGHDIPYQRRRIMEICRLYNAGRLIIDATGIGGAFEQELRMECIPDSIQFIPFIFTGGTKGSKGQVYRDYNSAVQQKQIIVPDPQKLEGKQKKIMWKWYREHIDLEYVMDTSQKTEKIGAPQGKHDDFCDSSVLGIYATLSMLPSESTFSTVSLERGSKRPRGRHTVGPLFATGRRSAPIFKRPPRGL
jgi:hypothetical protein